MIPPTFNIKSTGCQGFLYALTLSAFLSGCAYDDGHGSQEAGSIIPVVTVLATGIAPGADNQLVTLPFVPEPSRLRLVLEQEATGRRAEWASVDSFDLTMLYHEGAYTLSAFYGSPYDEGYDSPFFIATRRFSIANNATAIVPLEARLGNTALTAEFSGEFESTFNSFGLTFHSFGGDYLTATTEDEGKALYLRPGRIAVDLDMTLPDGRSATINATYIENAEACCFYKASVELLGDGTVDNSAVLISFDEKSLADDITVNLSEAIFSDERPQLTASGFSPDSPLTLTEGSIPDEPVVVTADGPALKSLMLSVQSVALRSAGWPAEIDLLNLSDAERNLADEWGLTLDTRAGSNHSTVDFTKLLPKLRVGDESGKIAFIMTAKSTAGEISRPMRLGIDLRKADFSTIEISQPVVGIDIATLRIPIPAADLSRNLTIEQYTGGSWQQLEIKSIATDSTGVSAVRFHVNDGSENIELRLIYCGEVRQKLTLRRKSPPIAIKVDPFARTARIKVESSSPELVEAIVSKAIAFDRHSRHTITMRDPSRGELIVAGLEPSTPYSLALSMFLHPEAGDYSNWADITTESAAQLPNSDFEETRTTIKEHDMPCGGRYSQSIVAIFNGLNLTDWEIATPRRWTSVNPKTFCTDAANHNTWYMQPSCRSVTDAASGSFAVELRSVAWDPDGEPIPDYLQESQPYVRYSRNVPRIAYRAAGKLFLGSYRFDPLTLEETYNEGLDFTSRPASLNGYYKYLPGDDMPTDRGTVAVELLGLTPSGEETVIASGRLELPFSTGYTAFSLPLEYAHFGVKASRIKVMFASSRIIGDITRETTEIETTPYPAEAASIGGVLTLDNITLSY